MFLQSLAIRDDVKMWKNALSKYKVREDHNKTMLGLVKKNGREEYQYCLKLNGQ
jgi:hypothetical protein